MISLADIITPNGFEAEILTGISANSAKISTVIKKLHNLGPRIVIVTSVLENDQLSLYASDGKSIYEIPIPLISENFTGTGDTFSALLLGHLNKLPLKDACLKAVDTMISILRNTIEKKEINASGTRELALVQSRELILNPPSTLEAIVHHHDLNAI
jgi:pyridoxine kinase